jgi:hypothetical protein
MGSSVKKKKDKKKDFQVCRQQWWFVQSAINRIVLETKAQSWESAAKTDQFYRHQFQV